MQRYHSPEPAALAAAVLWLMAQSGNVCPSLCRVRAARNQWSDRVQPEQPA
ncbi:MAG TPA: hypothetical protein PKE63_03925 [Lacibacter sp.]|nr:hypothetical protein [Lacibacter sp.]HMO89575.1 hypothetical protein [Lacibacter sp.]HMP86398.1 hypothetical protein [Lacibacter sp.]